MNDILHRVAELFEVTVADLTGRRRTARIVQARFAAAYALHRQYPGMPLSAIGRALGGRDHSTIINAIRRAEALARDDSDYRAKLRALTSGPSPPEVGCSMELTADVSGPAYAAVTSEGVIGTLMHNQKA